MKHIISVFILLSLTDFSYAKTSPEAYMGKIPAAPKNCCGINAEDKSSYKKSVKDLDAMMKNELDQRTKEIDAYANANKEKMMSGMTSDVTLPEGMEEKARKSKKKMTKEERKAMRDQILQQYGVSPDDADSFKTMSKEEREAWARNHAAKMDKTAQANQKTKATNNQGRSKLNAINEQQALLAKFNARMTGIQNKFAALDEKAIAVEKKEIDPIKAKLRSYGDIISKEQEPLLEQDNKKFEAAKKRYCETLSPQYRPILDEYLSVIKASMPDFKRMDELTAQIQLAIDKPIDALDGFTGISFLRGYLEKLKEVFKYDIQGSY